MTIMLGYTSPAQAKVSKTDANKSEITIDAHQGMWLLLLEAISKCFLVGGVTIVKLILVAFIDNPLLFS